MNKYERFIWERVGSPEVLICHQCDEYRGKDGERLCLACGYRVANEPIDIGLSHVLKALSELNVNISINTGGRCYALKYTIDNCAGDYLFLFEWLFLKESGEQAIFRDQSIETQQAICKLLGMEDE